MQAYIQTSLPPRTPQSLDVAQGGKTFRFSLLLVKADNATEGSDRKRVREHRHDLYHMALYTRGSNQISFKGKRYTARPGTLLLTAPGEAHELNAMLPGELRYSEIKFAYAASDGTALQLPFHQLLSLHAGVELAPRAFPIDLTPPQIQESEGFVERTIYWLRTPGRLSMMFAAQMIHALFVFLIRELFVPEGKLHDPLSAAIQRAREHIDCHYSNPVTLTELAAMAGFSQGYFLRSFKRLVGLSPIAYQQQLRIAAARTLLRSTNLQCKEIAAHVGFGDIYQFSKTFKKVTGLSPRQHRAEEGGTASR